MRLLAVLVLLAPLAAAAQTVEPVEPALRVEPASWWTGMHHPELQVLLYGEDVGRARVTLAPHAGVTLDRVVAVESPNYLFLDLTVGPDAEPGPLAFTLDGPGGPQALRYELRERTRPPGSYAQGFSSEDVIYLMMPDRFANGDPANDAVPGMLEGADRSDPNARQGGDFAGVMEHLDYIDRLGMTALWFTPVFENDMTPEYGAYHGYAATDLYRVDRRFGSNDEFVALVDAVHQRGLTVIMDMIHNHIGDRHWWMADLPTPDWVHDLDRYGTTHYRTSVAVDPYASAYDRAKLTKAWFVPAMPDLNQRNELLARYLLQNTVWWIETSGIDGIRMDTYPYPDKDYMARWAAHVLDEYPDFHIVGEAWMHSVPHGAYWQSGYPSADGYDSNIDNVTDFPMREALIGAFTEGPGWATGLNRLYLTLGQDAIYPAPQELVAFLDNHDLPRAFSALGEDEAALRMAYAVLMTLPRIPQVYYGTELAMPNGAGAGGSDGAKRMPMPGGWPGDDRSVFVAADRTAREARTYAYVAALTQWRKTADAVHHGRTTQFVPDGETYVFFRWTDSDAVMTVVNAGEDVATLDLVRFAERTDGYATGRDVTTGAVHDLRQPALTVPARTALVLELAR